jgi:hypothetical protein
MKRATPDPFPLWQAAGLILLATLLCYWPLSAGIFSAKNDNINQFLPIRHQVVEALRQGDLPLWTPYNYLGYPLHGDMQGGAWNPVVWLLALFGRYTLTSLHAEILFAVFLSGLGMHRLLRYVGLPSLLQLTGAIVYLLSGYLTDSGGSNLPFLWAAAWVPFTLAYFGEWLRNPHASLAIKAAASFALLLVSAYPSFFILTAYILAAGFIYALVAGPTSRRWLYARQLPLLVLLFLLLALPAILSYAQVLPFYKRSEGVSLQAATENPFSLKALYSFFFPAAAIKTEMETDLISRNAYFSLPLLLAIPFAFRGGKQRLTRFTAAGFLFFLLFSLGHATPVRGICYQLLPLMDTFRHPSNARLFVIISGTTLGLIGILRLLDGSGRRALQIALSGAGLTLLLLACFGPALPSFAFSSLSREDLKLALEEIEPGELALLLGVIQLLFLVGFGLAAHRRKMKATALLLILNAVIMAQLSLPYTLVSKTPPTVINQLLNRSPEGFPLPDPSLSIREASADALLYFDILGVWGFYTKRIGVTREVFTPTFVSKLESIMHDSLLYKTILENPYAYFPARLLSWPDGSKGSALSTAAPSPADGEARFRLSAFSSSSFQFTTSTSQQRLFCLQQLALPGWKATIDGKTAPLLQANGFMLALLVPQGQHKVSFTYSPTGVRAAAYLSMALSLLCLAYLFIKRRKHD